MSINNISFLELKTKEIVNVVDGKKLGRIVDLVFTCNGYVIGFVAPGNKKMFKCLNSSDNIFIPWNNICKIGDDVILVELIESNINSCSCEENN